LGCAKEDTFLLQTPITGSLVWANVETAASSRMAGAVFVLYQGNVKGSVLLTGWHHQPSNLKFKKK
jgi:hypothetical protein